MLNPAVPLAEARGSNGNAEGTLFSPRPSRALGPRKAQADLHVGRNIELTQSSLMELGNKKEEYLV